MKLNYKYTLFSDHQILGKPYISINMTTAINDEYNEVGSKIVFKIDEIINVIKVGNHIQCQSQHYFLVNDYQSRISSELANLNEVLENSCRILLEQSSESIIKLASRISVINNRTISHSISPSRESEIEDDFSGQQGTGNSFRPGNARVQFRYRKSSNSCQIRTFSGTTFAILKARLALIDKDDWSSFPYDSFPKRRVTVTKELEDDQKQQSKSAEFREHKIDMLAKAGEIGGIMKFILQNRDREVPENVVLKLRNKRPSPLQELSDQEKQGIIQVDITDSCRDVFGITGTRLRTTLRKRPKLKRAGPDKLR